MAEITRRVQSVAVQAATAQTDATVVAAVSGQRIRVHWLHFSSTPAGSVKLESGTTTRLFEAYLAANGNVALVGSEEQVLFSTAAGEALTYTTTGTGAQCLVVGYTVGS